MVFIKIRYQKYTTDNKDTRSENLMSDRYLIISDRPSLLESFQKIDHASQLQPINQGYPAPHNAIKNIGAQTEICPQTQSDCVTRAVDVSLYLAHPSQHPHTRFTIYCVSSLLDSC